MGGPDVLANPEPRVGHPDVVTVLTQPAGELGPDGAGLRLGKALAAQVGGIGVQAATVEPLGHQRKVVVAGGEDDLRARRQRGAEGFHHRTGGRHRLPGRPVAHLDDVSQEHEPVDVGQPRAELVEGLGAPQDVHRPAGTEVEVGDDERPHGPGGE